MTDAARQERKISDLALARQSRKIIQNRLALLGEESVSVGHRGSRRRANQENPLMRIYIIGNDGITLCRETLATVNEGEIAVASNKETLPRSAASGSWHCGMLRPMSKSGRRSATAGR